MAVHNVLYEIDEATKLGGSTLDAKAATVNLVAATGKMGLFGAAAVVQPADVNQADQGALTQVAAPVGGTGATAGAYDTAANRDLMITSVNAARDDIIALDKLLTEVRTALVNLGLMKGAA